MDKETSEIAALTGRISKDPKSKLFVPLAEEYKKAGDIEMAIRVLLEGLKNNPDYVTARSSLGKLLLEKGDLVGAQKEFEEVVKTMPDNLMAQKKLGHLFIHQNRPHDALEHYKIALSLNPSDGELASLISDIEAGQDVRSKIQLSKVKATAEQAVKQPPPAPSAAREPGPASVPPQTSKVEPRAEAETPPETQAVISAPSAEAARAPSSSVMEMEEPEEVLVVEPLEPEMSMPEPAAAGFYLPGEQEPEVVPSITAGEIIEAEIGEEVAEKAPAPIREEVSEISDDFTTDTLAELYIVQGFFEKAIEIYERMLADKPNSQGLKDKLALVRDAVARTATPEAEKKMEPDIFAGQADAGEVGAATSAFDELDAYPPTQESETEGFKPETVSEPREDVLKVEPEEPTTDAGALAEPGEFSPGEPSPDENIFAESREYKPASVPEEQPPAGVDAGFDEEASFSVQEQARPKPQYADFEPREYIPPTAEPAAEKVIATPTPIIAGHKKTIARLETWLTNIKKER